MPLKGLEAVFITALWRYLTKKNDGEENFGLADGLTWTFVGLHFLEDFVGLVSRPKTITASFWGMYALASSLVLGVGAVIAYVGLKYLDHEDRAEVSGNYALNIGFTFIAYGATMIFLRTARWLILLRSIGINVITMLRIMEDVVSVFIVFLVIYLSFGMGIWFM